MSTTPPGAAELRASQGRLASTATERMTADMPWFASLPAQERSAVGSMVHAGIDSFVQWYVSGSPDQVSREQISAALFRTAPRSLAGVISLEQTVDLVRLSLDVVEENLVDLVPPDALPTLAAAVSRYGREVAFATAEVYARAAEERGRWDARLEALVVDAVLRPDADEAVLSRASALGWRARGSVAVVLGNAPRRRDSSHVFEEIRRRAAAQDLDALCALQGERMVVVLGGVPGDEDDGVRAAARAVEPFFGRGAVVVGPCVDSLGRAFASGRAALSGLRAASGWPDAPRPVLSDELMVERALAGDGHARRFLGDEVYSTLAQDGTVLLDTLSAYFAEGGSIEAASRRLYLHSNTVRYRLKRVTALTGLSVSSPRAALTLQIALILGRQAR